MMSLHSRKLPRKNHARGRRAPRAATASALADRREAGRRLAALLLGYAHEDVVVVGIPRGGIIVAAEIAGALGAPLDVCVARKVALPNHSEIGIGAVAEGGAFVLDPIAARDLTLSPASLDHLLEYERRRVAARVTMFREGVPALPRLDVANKVIVLVDDGVATGGTVRAALHDLRAQKPRRVVVAVPVGEAGVLEALEDEADDVVALLHVPRLRAVSDWYADFAPVDDDEALRVFRRFRTVSGESRTSP